MLSLHSVTASPYLVSETRFRHTVEQPGPEHAVHQHRRFTTSPAIRSISNLSIPPCPPWLLPFHPPCPPC